MFAKLGLDLNDKNKSIFLGLGILFVTFLICSNITKANSRKVSAMRKKISAESERFILRTDIENIEKKQREYAKYFYDDISQQELRAIISDIAREIGVNIVSIKPLGKDITGNLSKESLDISIRSTYNQLGEFISRIENLDRITKIESLSMEGISDFKNYGIGSEELQKEIMESDAKLAVYMIICAYSVKD
jgi:Tfp pilus assembly protein PilO